MPLFLLTYGVPSVSKMKGDRIDAIEGTEIHNEPADSRIQKLNRQISKENYLYRPILQLNFFQLLEEI